MTKNSRKILGMVLCGLFAALVAVGAFIQVPLMYDYFTLQTFFVMLAGMLIGSKLGAISVAVYVFIGLIGIPIFAAGGGIGYVVRPTFGFLLGFIAGAWLTGFVCEKMKKRGFWDFFAAGLAGLAVIYLIGLIYKYFILNFYMGTPMPWSVILLSVFPLDLPGDLVLCFIAAFIGKRLDKVKLGRLNDEHTAN